MPNEIKFKHLQRWASVDPAFGSTDNYVGERPEDWYVCVGRNRDSDVLINCNFEVGLKELGGEVDGRVRVFRTGHWACGWVELVLIHESAVEELAIAENIGDRLSDYPVLDEDAYSAAQEKDFEACWENFGRSDFERDLIKYVENERHECTSSVTVEQVVEAVLGNINFSCLINRAYHYQCQDSREGTCLTVNQLLHSLDRGELSYDKPDSGEFLTILRHVKDQDILHMIERFAREEASRHEQQLLQLKEMGIET